MAKTPPENTPDNRPAPTWIPPSPGQKDFVPINLAKPAISPAAFYIMLGGGALAYWFIKKRKP